MTYEPTPTEILLGQEGHQKSIAFQDEICSTPPGRRSFELRERAHALHEKGEAEPAFVLCEEAAGLFSAEDPGPAAAMAWYDLARRHEFRTDGVRAENLRHAEALLRRALASPALGKDPHRMAMVRDALASCLRQLAYKEGGTTKETLLAEATKLFEEAVMIALSNGDFGFEDVLRFSHNLGNCLAQQGRFDAALVAMDRAEEYARRLKHLVEPAQQAEYLSMVLLRSAHYRNERGRDGDRAQAKRGLVETISIQHPGWVDMARMRLAGLLLRDPGASKDEALALLHRVRVERIRPTALSELVALYTDAGLRKEALVLLHQQLQKSMERWHDAKADHVADHHAAEAQQAAHLAARLHLEEEDAVEAFLTLEDVSGLRFVEAIEAPSRLVQSPTLRVVWGYHHAKSVLAACLEAAAGQVAQGLIHADQLQDAAKDFTSQLADAGSVPSTVAGELPRIFEQATKHSDPVGFLRRESLRIGEEVKRLNEKLREIDPETARTDDKPWLYRLTREVMRNLLRQYPEHALVRLSFAEDLLVIAVWLEGDEVVARHHRVPMPAELFDRLSDHQRDSKKGRPELLKCIQADLESLDLSPALPPKRMAHAVLLPSFLGFFLPLGALGPAGETLLDRFDALSWMPCLAPLFIRQAPLRPREGVVSVAPGGTYHHGFAFGVPLPGERRIEGPEATEENVLAAASEADVMCLYTHGKHAGPRGPHVDLYGSDHLGEPSAFEEWAGMERIELWACQSGVNAPTDPLASAVDEAFGLDVEFVRHGVRSAIGTLWSVPDLVTACLVRHYRRGLKRGLPAPHALADAQRFWRDEGAQSLLEHLTRAPDIKQGLRSFQATLGAEGEESLEEAEIEALLGPAPSPGENAQTRIEAQVRRLSHPLAWAGFRFIGVAERRPIGTYNPDLFRPSTPEEVAEGERIVAETLREDASRQERRSFPDWVEKWLTEARRLAPGAHPSPEQAIRVARLYRDRIVSSQRNNLLAALAWLHEAMAALKWTHHGARRREASQSLGIEAAWLWIELALGDAVSVPDLLLCGPHAVALARAKRLLDELPEDDQARVARAWLALLEAISKRADGLEASFGSAWEAVAPVAQRTQADTYESVRMLTAVWEIVYLGRPQLTEAVNLCASRFDADREHRSWSIDLAASRARLHSIMALVTAERSPEVLRDVDGTGLLTERELAREMLITGRANNEALSHEVPMSRKRLNRTWDALEGALWGWPDDDRSPIWASTGTLGGAYRRLAGSLSAGLAMAPENSRDALQLIACLQPLCDLRLPLLRRLVWLLLPWKNRPAMIFWLWAREREILLEYLEDAALLPDLKRLAKGGRGAERAPHRLDPFLLSAAEVQKQFAGVEDLVPWQVGHACGWLPGERPSARTAAFHAVRNVEIRTEELGRMWQLLTSHDAEIESRGTTPAFARMFDPGLRLPSRQDLLHQLAPGGLVLGFAIEPAGHLVTASIWHGPEGIKQKVFTSAALTGWRLRDLLAALHVGLLPDHTPAASSARARAETWREIAEILGPSLDAVLGPALADGPMRIAVLAPGALRPLPLLALPVAGVPLFERVASVVHVPTLAHEPPVLEQGQVEACWLARDRDEGDTSLGEAAVQTLCRWFETEIIEPPTHPTHDIPEVDQLDPLGPRIASLCIYAGASSVVIRPSLSSVHLGGSRAFGDKNTRGLFLPSCEVVELWTATAGIGPVEAIRRDDRDRIPGLARDFLASGAAAVLDLAWPVCDLVKALVCERFGIVRRVQQMDGAAALREAVAGTAELLARWRTATASTTFADVRETLAWLDEERGIFARSVGLDARAVVPLAARHDAPSLKGLSVEALACEACNPVHLAAFRYWTWL